MIWSLLKGLIVDQPFLPIFQLLNLPGRSGIDDPLNSTYLQYTYSNHSTSDTMTRTGPPINPISWDTKTIVPDDGSRIDSVACQDARPKGRIRRSMTACNTCRKLKTRCDVDPRGHACRRCLSLRSVPFLFCVFAYTLLAAFGIDRFSKY